jgi:hypothetical protein
MRYVTIVFLFLCSWAIASPVVHLSFKGYVNLESADKLQRDVDTLSGFNVLVLYVKSPGGDIIAEQMIIKALSKFKQRGGTIIMQISEAQSAAAMFSCVADERVLLPGGFLMYHTWSEYTPKGKVKITKYTKKLRHTDLWDWQHEWLEYCGLKPHQIKQIEAGKDMYITNTKIFYR